MLRYTFYQILQTVKQSHNAELLKKGPKNTLNPPSITQSALGDLGLHWLIGILSPSDSANICSKCDAECQAVNRPARSGDAPLHGILQKPCVYVSNNKLIYSYHEQVSIAEISNIPMTVNGTAKHNIENALGVIGLCKALNISDENICLGLTRFGSNPNDNPGRGNIYQVNGVTVIIDFAHNSHSMQALVNMTSNMPTNKKHVMFSHGGDRSDQEILDVAAVVRELQPDTYVLTEIEKYLRGRELNEISHMVKDNLLAEGVSEESILLASDPLDGTKKIMQRAQSGDIVLLFVLTDRDKVQAYLTE